MNHGTFNFNKMQNMFCFNYLINRMQKTVTKNKSKKFKKGRQSSKSDISNFKLECAKTFLMKFC